jgi:hypothetical protein
MHLGADVVGDDTHDALAVLRRQSLRSLGPPPRRSTHSQPPGLSMTSTMAGSSSQLVIAPIAVRSMPMLREAASDLRETVPTAVPEVCDRLSKKTNDREKATTEVRA